MGIDRKVRETTITSKSHLQEQLQEEWTKIPSNLLKNLVSSGPHPLQRPSKQRAYIQNTKLYFIYRLYVILSDFSMCPYINVVYEFLLL